MPEVVVTKPREGKFNKNAARRVRVAGKIPAVLYGAGHDAVAVEVDPKQISRILFSETGQNTIFDVEVAGSPAAKAMIVDTQREPIKDKLIHIDMKRIALDKVLRVSVRVKLLGIPVGVKTEGGILDQVLREVEIECLPADIPNHIDVDVSELAMHGVLRISDLPHSDKIKYLNNEDATVAHVVSIREEVVAAPAEGEVVAVGEAGATPTEPEVAKKGKGEPAAAEGAAKAHPLPEGRSKHRWTKRSENGNRTGPPKPFLVVGLGNPGLEYLWTPHNAGFMAIDRIAEQEGVVVQNRRCRAVTATCRIAGRETILAKPETFMNLSGLALAALIRGVRGGPGTRPARDLRRAGSGAGDIQDQGARFARGTQRSPQRNHGPGQPGVAAVAHRRGTGFAARSHSGQAAKDRAGIISSRPCARRIWPSWMRCSTRWQRPPGASSRTDRAPQ